MSRLEEERGARWFLTTFAAAVAFVCAFSLSLFWCNNFSPSHIPVPVAGSRAEFPKIKPKKNNAPPTRPTGKPAGAANTLPLKNTAAGKTTFPRWGGAFSSAAEDGTGFFDRDAAAAFATAEIYAARRAGDPEARRRVVRLKSRALRPDPDATLTEIFPPKEKKAGGSVKERRQLVYLQFETHPSPELRAVLRRGGVRLLSPVGGLTWLARGSRTALAAARRRSGVRALARVDPRDKLQPLLFKGRIPSYSKNAAGRLRLRVLGFLTVDGDTDAETWAGRLRKTVKQLGGELRGSGETPVGPTASILLPPEKLTALAADPEVHCLETAAPPIRSSSLDVARQSNVDDVRDGGPLLSGSGVTAAVREIGQATLHSDYKDRFIVKDSDGDTSSSSANHSTGVVGVLGSSGTVFPNAEGMAPAVSILFYTVTEGGAADGYLQTGDLTDAAGNGARLSTHSYGPAISSSTNGTLFGAYQADSAAWDQAAVSGDLVVVFAAGNERNDGDGTAVGGELYDNIDFLSGAKNTIDVGAVGTAAHAADPDEGLSAAGDETSFSSYGPMDDGRIKPDLVAGGVDVLTTQGLNGTQIVTGTSFSAPAVAGMIALLFEHYKNKVGGAPTAALVKALMLTTASDIESTGPDAKTGYGIADIEAPVKLLDQYVSSSESPFFEGSVSEGEEQTYSLSVAGESEIRIGLCWLDPAGDPLASKALVNDLDLEVVSPTGTTFYPFSLSAAAPNEAATSSGPNHADPYEQVVLTAPAAGTWTIRVKGTSVPQGPQDYALVVSKPASAAVAAGIAVSPSYGAAALEVYFSGSNSSGSITAYAWDFGDGTTGSSLNEVHTYTAPGTYTVRLTVTGVTSSITASAAVVIVVTRRKVTAYPSRIRGRVDFDHFNRDTMTLSLTVPELVRSSQDAREAIRNGEYEGKTFTVRLNGSTVKTFILDHRAKYRDKTAMFKLIPRRGKIVTAFRHADFYLLFTTLGMTSDPESSGSYSLPVQVEGNDAVYEATFSLSYLNRNGRVGRIVTPRKTKP